MARQLNSIGLYIAAACVIGSLMMAVSAQLDSTTATNGTTNTAPTMTHSHTTAAQSTPHKGGAVSVVGSLVMISGCLLVLHF
jgi:hypothetical protein